MAQARLFEGAQDQRVELGADSPSAEIYEVQEALESQAFLIGTPPIAPSRRALAGLRQHDRPWAATPSIPLEPLVVHWPHGTISARSRLHVPGSGHRMSAIRPTVRDSGRTNRSNVQHE